MPLSCNGKKRREKRTNKNTGNAIDEPRAVSSTCRSCRSGLAARECALADHETLVTREPQLVVPSQAASLPVALLQCHSASGRLGLLPLSLAVAVAGRRRGSRVFFGGAFSAQSFCLQPLGGPAMASIGPSFSASRVLQFGALSQAEQDAFTRFFCNQHVQVRRWRAREEGGVASTRGGAARAGLEQCRPPLMPAKDSILLPLLLCCPALAVF